MSTAVVVQVESVQARGEADQDNDIDDEPLQDVAHHEAEGLQQWAEHLTHLSAKTHLHCIGFEFN